MADFDEFKDRDFADWKRVRSSIEHENTLVNHRLSWLFASHAFLYAAFAVVFNAWKNPNDGVVESSSGYQVLLILVSMIGVFICGSIQRGLWEAEDQITLLDRWWYDKTDQRSSVAFDQAKSNWRVLRGLRDKDHPPIQGGPVVLRPILYRFIGYTFAPTVFLIVWLLIVVLVVLGYSSLQPVVEFIAKNGLRLLSYVVAIFVGVIIWEWIRRFRRPLFNQQEKQ